MFSVKFCSKAVAAVLFAALTTGAAQAETIETVYNDKAGNDFSKLQSQVDDAARFAQAKVEADGVEAAVKIFRAPPWKRQANGLHIWGVTREGISWFDAGHPEMEGLNVSEMSDLNGRNWSKLALIAGDGAWAKGFEITFPHPTLKRSARGWHNCFVVKDSDRVLCAGAFLDGE